MEKINFYSIYSKDLKILNIKTIQDTDSFTYYISINPYALDSDNSNQKKRNINYIEKIFEEFLDKNTLIKNNLKNNKEYVKKIHLNNIRLNDKINNNVISSPSILEKYKPYFMDVDENQNLYKFQVKGIKFLLSNNKVILADDMGTGKTLQSLIALRKHINSEELINCLILCPTNLVKNWENEILKWVPELEFISINPKSETKDLLWEIGLNDTNIMLCSYDQLKTAPDKIINNKYKLIIADEAHKIRKSSSEINNKFSKLKTEKLWLLTGTPYEQSIEDIKVLLNMLAPKKPVSSYFDSLNLLRNAIKPYTLRREKKDILKELPSLKEINIKIELTKSQREAYSNLKSKPSNELNPLAKLNKLRELCDYDSETLESAKINETLNLIDNIKQKNEKIVIFSYLITPLEILFKKLKNLYGNTEYSMISGKQTLEKRNQLINDFTNIKENSILLASTRAASEGINLTSANHLILFNKWWNPSNNNQTRDRVHRIGQTKEVFIYSFICTNTVEENLEKIISNKEFEFDQLINNLSDRKNNNLINKII